jgi:hypothetical protein
LCELFAGKLGQKNSLWSSLSQRRISYMLDCRCNPVTLTYVRRLRDKLLANNNNSTEFLLRSRYCIRSIITISLRPMPVNTLGLLYFPKC